MYTVQHLASSLHSIPESPSLFIRGQHLHPFFRHTCSMVHGYTFCTRPCIATSATFPAFAVVFSPCEQGGWLTWNIHCSTARLGKHLGCEEKERSLSQVKAVPNPHSHGCVRVGRLPGRARGGLPPSPACPS